MHRKIGTWRSLEEPTGSGALPTLRAAPDLVREAQRAVVVAERRPVVARPLDLELAPLVVRELHVGVLNLARVEGTADSMAVAEVGSRVDCLSLLVAPDYFVAVVAASLDASEEQRQGDEEGEELHCSVMKGKRR